MDNARNLQRFLEAQDPCIDRVFEELRQGRKRSHWMWFVFPQIAGLGQSLMAQRYAIGSREEALAYLQHPVLGSRLVTCTNLVMAAPNSSIQQIFGSPDDLKFHSSMTLFAEVQFTDVVFAQALQIFFAAKRDEGTLGCRL